MMPTLNIDVKDLPLVVRWMKKVWRKRCKVRLRRHKFACSFRLIVAGDPTDIPNHLRRCCYCGKRYR